MDLRELMQSPTLALEPLPTLDTVVRREARALRRRRRSVAAALSLVGFAGGVAVLPGLLAPDRVMQVPGGMPTEDYGIRGATSDVVLLEEINGAKVVAWYEGRELCIATIRVKRGRTCAPAVDPATTNAFPHVFPLEVTRVDDRRLLVGQHLGDVDRAGVTVRVDLDRQPGLVATGVSGRGFPLPVFYVELPKGAVPTEVRGLDQDGRTVARRKL